jgi:hypothetical protein
VVRMRYRSICPACGSKWTPEAQVPLIEPGPPVSGLHSSMHGSIPRVTSPVCNTARMRVLNLYNLLPAHALTILQATVR